MRVRESQLVHRAEAGLSTTWKANTRGSEATLAVRMFMRKATAVLGVGVSGTLLGVLGGYAHDVYSSARFVHELEKAYGRLEDPTPTMSSAVRRVLASDWGDLHYPRWALTLLRGQAIRGVRRCRGQH